MSEHSDTKEVLKHPNESALADTAPGVKTSAKVEAAAEGASLPEVNPAHYEVQEEFARGGLGRIMKAQDKRLGRPVALKELLHKQNKAQERFLQEALITARLQHPAIVPIYEAGVWPSGEPFYTMKLVSGKPLSQLIFEAPNLSARLALLPSMIAVCEALAYAHSKKIIHRDLKPQNVLVGEFGETVVIDWGLAKDLTGSGQPLVDSKEPKAREGQQVSLAFPSTANRQPSTGPTKPPSGEETLPYKPHLSTMTIEPTHEEAGLTVAGSVLGTPGYMPPEQAQGKPVDERADVYSLGVILYTLLSGKAPYEGKSAREILAQVIEGKPIPIEARCPDAPIELIAIVHKAMSYQPQDRYPSAKGLLEELLRFTSGQLIRSHAYSPLELLGRVFRRYRAVITVGAAALFLLTLVISVSAWKLIDTNQKLTESLKTAKDAQQKAEQQQQEAKEQRNEANQRRSEAEQRALYILESQGRQELQAGQFSRAAWFLYEAYRRILARGEDPSSIRVLLGQAMRAIESQEAVLSAHKSTVESAVFSPDGKWILSRDEEGYVFLWDSFSGALVQKIETFPSPETFYPTFLPNSDRFLVLDAYGAIQLRSPDQSEPLRIIPTEISRMASQVTLSADGTKLAITDIKSITIWSISTGALLSQITMERALTAKSISFSKDASRLLRMGYDGLQLWDIARATKVFEAESKSEITGAYLTPDETGCVTTDKAGNLIVWDFKTKAPRLTLKAHSSAAYLKAVSPDGARLVTTAVDGRLKLWTFAGELLESFEGHTGWVTSVTFSPDGQYLASTSTDQTSRLWEISSGKLVLALEGHRGAVQSAHFSYDGKALVTTSYDTTVRIWDVSPILLPRTFSPEVGPLYQAQFMKNDELFVGGYEGVLYDRKTGEKKLSVPGDKRGFVASAISKDGERIAIESDITLATLFDRSGRIVREITECEGAIMSLSFSEDGRYLACGCSNSSAQLYDAQSGALLFRLVGHKGSVNRVIFSPDSTRLLTIASDPTPTIWETSSGRRLVSFEGHNDWVFSGEFSSDGSKVVTYERETTSKQKIWSVSIWEASTGRLLRRIEGHTDQITQARFRPKHNQLLTMGAEGSIKLWDLSTGECLLSWTGHFSVIAFAVFSLDGTRLLTASRDNTAKLWDLRTGTPLASFENHTGAVLVAEFSKDGTQIMTASEDGTAKLWTIPIEEREPQKIEEILRERTSWEWRGDQLLPVQQ